MSASLVTTIEFRSFGYQLVVDRVERAAFVMDYENVDMLGGFQVEDGRLVWVGFNLDTPPDEIVKTVHSMIGGAVDILP